MYKVYINRLLKELPNHYLAISINQPKLNLPTFADDITLLALHWSFLQALMEMCYNYSLCDTISTVLIAELLCMVKPNQLTLRN